MGTYESVVTSCSIIVCGKIAAKASGPTGSMVAGFKGGSSWKGRSGRRLYQLSGKPVSDCSTSRLQVFIQKGYYLRVGVESVLQFGQTVALVLVEQILDLASVLFHPIDDLLGLPDGHAGIVLAVDDHERGRDVPGFVDGAYGLQ